jgi:hypothetical protein
MELGTYDVVVLGAGLESHGDHEKTRQIIGALNKDASKSTATSRSAKRAPSA